MQKNPVQQLNDLYLDFAAGRLDRRAFMVRASQLGIGALALNRVFSALPASAQDATPEPTYEPFTSATREEAKAKIAADFPFTADPGAATQGGTVIWGEAATSSISTLNPILVSDIPTSPFVSMMFEQLVGGDPMNAQFVPGLADYWEIAEDGKTYTFHLHEGVTWHDGTPFTADDVIFSMDIQSNEAVGSSYTATFTATVASYSKIDDLTVQLVAADVFAQVVFLGNSYCPIIAKHIWEGVAVDNATWSQDPGSTGEDAARVVGTGPFKWGAKDESAGTWTLVRNDAYWDDVPVIDEMIFQNWPDEVAVVEALRAGDIDFCGITSNDVESLSTEENVSVAVYDTFTFSFFAGNMDPEKSPLFGDVKVRQAMVIALDRQAIVDNILLGYGTVANGSQPTLSVAFAPDRITTKYGYDVAKASALLAEAGWVAGSDGILEKDGVKFSFKNMYANGSPQRDSIAAAMQDNWLAVGIDCQPDPVDFAKVLVPALTDTFDFEACFLGFVWDATGDQSAMFATGSYGGGFNFMKYSNTAVDELMAEANKELDPEKRVELLIQANDMINEDIPLTVLWFNQDLTGFSKRLNNFTPNATGGLVWSMPYVWVTE